MTLLQLTRGHDKFHVSIAAAHEPDDWCELGEAIDLAKDIGATGERGGNYTMSDFERLFRAHIEVFKILFSEREYTRTSRRRFAKRMSRS
jgi:hypothetical protein